MTSDDYQPFETANELLSSHEKLTAQMDRDGYLFVRRLIDQQIIDRLRRDIRSLLIEHGYVEDDPQLEVKWSGKMPDGDEIGICAPLQRQISDMPSMHALIEAEPLMHFLATLFDGEVFSWVENFDRIRIYFQDVGATTAGGQQVAYATPAHQDGYHFPKRFFSVWIPLMDIDLAVGGLALRAGSHTEGLQQHWWKGPQYLGIADTADQSEAFARQGGVAVAGDVEADARPKTWLRSDYRVGDAMIFHPRLVHRGVGNTSQQLRLSADLRYSRQGDPLVWQAQCRLYECHAYLDEARNCLDEMQLDPAVADRAWEMMRRAGPSDELDVNGQARQMVEQLTSAVT